MNESLNAANFITKIGLAALSAAASFGVGKTLEAKAEKELGSDEKAAKAKKMAGYAVGGIALAALLWFIGTRLARKNAAPAIAAAPVPPKALPPATTQVQGKRG